MSIINNFLQGKTILKETTSLINGNISVVKVLGFGTYIQVADLTQSGGVVNTVWRQCIRKIKKVKPELNNCLILGLGGGSAAKQVNKNWPNAKITGVEIDPVMVELGKIYLGLNEKNLEIIVGDGLEYLNQKRNKKKKGFDLILIDIYIGDNVPEKFESDRFLKLTKKALSKNGVIVFNRLYYKDKRAKAVKFGKKLEKVFSKVDYVYPEANLMLICRL